MKSASLESQWFPCHWSNTTFEIRIGFMKTATETSAKAREAMKKFDTVRSAVVWKIASKTIPLPNKQVKLDTEYKHIRKAEEIKDRSAEQLSSLSRVVLFIAQRHRTRFRIKLYLSWAQRNCSELSLSSAFYRSVFQLLNILSDRGSCFYKCFVVPKCSDFSAKSV